MIQNLFGTYSIDGTPCRTLIEHAIARGWAKKPAKVIIQTVIEKEEKRVKPIPPSPAHVPFGESIEEKAARKRANENSVPWVSLEERAKMAGLTVDQLLDMRMRNRERTDGKNVNEQ